MIAKPLWNEMDQEMMKTKIMELIDAVNSQPVKEVVREVIKEVVVKEIVKEAPKPKAIKAPVVTPAPKAETKEKQNGTAPVNSRPEFTFE